MRRRSEGEETSLFWIGNPEARPRLALRTSSCRCSGGPRGSRPLVKRTRFYRRWIRNWTLWCAWFSQSEGPPGFIRGLAVWYSRRYCRLQDYLLLCVYTNYRRPRREERKKICNIIIIIIIIINIAKAVVAEVSRALGRIFFSMIMRREKNIHVIFISTSSVNITIKRKKRFRNARRRHDLRYYYNIIHCNSPVASVTEENFACWNKKKKKLQ